MKYLKILFISLLFIIPIKVKADDIENYLINATLTEDGDLIVEEYFNLIGDYNGYERVIKFLNEDAYPFYPEFDSYGGSVLHNADNLILEKICAVPVDANFSFTNIDCEEFSQVSSAKIGDYQVYEKNYQTGQYTYRIYLPSQKKKAFYLKYTLTNLAIKHNDIGEIGWNIFTREMQENILNLKVTINFPEEGQIRAWAHGPLHGQIEINSNKVEATIQNLYSYTPVDIRVIFPTNLIAPSSKTTNVAAFQKILNYEEDMAQKANYEREQKDKQTQSEAQEALTKLSIYLERYYYNEAKSIIEKIQDKEVKEEYTKKLLEFKDLLDAKELKEAQEELRYAQSFPTYYNYKYALEKINILDNQELKNELLTSLELVKDQIIKAEKNANLTSTTIAFIFFTSLLATIIVYFIIDYKTYKSNFNQKYLREFPDNFSPTTVAYLFKKKIANDALSAAILNLNVKKIIKIEQDTKDNYKIYKEDIEPKDLSESEKALLKLLFDTKSQTDLKTIQKSASNSSYAHKWENFVKLSTLEAKRERLYLSDIPKSPKKSSKILSIILAIFLFTFLGSPNPISFLVILIIGIIELICILKNKGKSTLIAGIISIVLFFANLILLIQTIIGNHYIKYAIILEIPNIILCLIFFIYILVINKRTIYGHEEYCKWKAFKNFLEDFGSMDEKDLPEIILWEKYLVYAICLGCAQKLAQTMNIKLQNQNIDSLPYNPYSLYLMNRSISHNVVRSINASNRYTNSSGGSSGRGSSGGSFSSGGGFGGGFSSGGGSFGGGGGGHRF